MEKNPKSIISKLRKIKDEKEELRKGQIKSAEPKVRLFKGTPRIEAGKGGPEKLTAMPEVSLKGKGAQAAKSKPAEKIVTVAKKIVKKVVEEAPFKKSTLKAPELKGASLESKFKSPVAKLIAVAKEREVEKTPVAIVQMGSHAGNFPFYPSYVKKLVKETPALASKIDTTSADSIKESIDKMSQDDKINLYKKFEKFGIYGADREYQPTDEDRTRLKNK